MGRILVSAAIEHIRAAGPLRRQAEIVDELVDHFSDLMTADPDAFRSKFRKMASSPFAFYRGSACLFYADMAREGDTGTDRRAGRVWIQGDLHAENFGSYMDSAGRLVFDVNDFDEAYVGHFGWDIRRLAASLALIGYAKAFSDEEIRTVVAACADSYRDQILRFAGDASDREFALTLQTTRGPLHQALEEARTATRAELLDRLTVVEGCERRFRRSERARDVDADTRARVEDAYRAYLETLPEPLGTDARCVKDLVATSGFGVGSAGLPAYTLLLEGHTEALETDVVLSMKQANVCACSRIVQDPHIRDYFEHHGHRTVLSQRALQAHADPWLGYTALDGIGQLVSELSPYENDLDWDAIADPDTMRTVVDQLGRAVAKIHSVADAHADQALVPFSSEEAIAASFAADGADFVAETVRFAVDYAELTREDHRLFVDAFRNHQIPGLQSPRPPDITTKED